MGAMRFQTDHHPVSEAPPPRGDSARSRTVHRCVFCGTRSESPETATAECNVRAHLGERFTVWRCSACRGLHCRDVVDLGHYYADYPFRRARLAWPMRLVYRTLLSRLKREGFDARRSLLDYGCGNGTFIEWLRERGIARVGGYDPYGPPDGLGDRRVLELGPFDVVLLQDVVEHVEDPAALLAELDGYAAPGGVIVIGTPNADRIDLRNTDRYINELHVPYHRHIVTRARLGEMGARLGWTVVRHYDRPYWDYPFLGLNQRAGREYQRLLGDGIDAFFEPVKIGRALTSPRYLFFAVFGWLLGNRADMTVVFRKTGVSASR